MSRKARWVRLLSATGWAMAAGAVQAQTLPCLIEPSGVVQLGSPVIGVIESMTVERGQFVRKGDVVATLQAGVERRALAMAQTRMEVSAELSAAQANLAFVQRKQERTESLVQQNFLSGQALDQARTETEIAERTVARAREQRRVAEQEWQLAQAQLTQRQIRSPIDGVVVDRYLSAGERVDERPIARIAATDPLRVEVIVPAIHYAQFRVGLKATVAPDLPGMPVRAAEVMLVDGVIDAASNTFRVRLELENRDRAVPAGARCKVAFEGVELQPAATRPTAIESTAVGPSARATGLARMANPAVPR